MQPNTLTLKAELMVVMIATFIMVLGRPAFAETAHVTQTGQTVSYADEDDGEIQAGVTPPTQRFKNNGDGTVTDKLTGLLWQ